MVRLKAFCVIFAVYFSVEVQGHGYMLTPPNRASLWRVDWTQPPNYNDNEYFCGGTNVQYNINNGKCGPCGDDFRDPVPRSNENGGTYGNGIIVANYTAGSAIKVTSMITANHLGNLYFHLCDLKDGSQPETEDCFKPLSLVDGTKGHQVQALDLRKVTKVKLPNDFVCERCVLRWHYRTGNSWGMCDDGTTAAGCGNQEIFRSCADIRIVPNDSSDEVSPLPPPPPPPPPQPDDSDDDSDYPSHEDPDSPEDPFDPEKEPPCILNPRFRRRNMEF